VELNILSVGVFSGKTFLIEGGPPSPTSLKSLTGAGLAKMVRKILSALGLEVKILTTKDLAVDGLISIRLSRPAPMIARMKSSVKVARHKIAVEKNWPGEGI